MFSSSQLSDEQKESLVKWATDGATIAELQRRLKDEFSISVTYMDARFLVLDLGIEIQEPQKDEPESEETAPAAGGGPAGEELPDVPGGVSVSVDELAMPGALVSGKVVFSDGEKAIWMLDQMGRPSLDPDTAGYRPSEGDIMAFQTKLRDLLSKEGG